MNKKYRSEDKKVVFITNCIPSIPETPQNQCHVKNVRHANHQDTRQLIASPPNVKAYNYRLGGVDKHDRLVGQHAIPLISKRGYLRIFFHHLDTELGKCVDLLQFNHQSEGWVEPGSQETLLTGLVQRINHIITMWPSYVSKIHRHCQSSRWIWSLSTKCNR